jgi:hypothetical protein
MPQDSTVTDRSEGCGRRCACRPKRSLQRHRSIQKALGLAIAIILSSIAPGASSTDGLLSELPTGEGADLIAPYELWVATFAPDEGSSGSGPRVLIITNDRKTAVAYLRGNRTELQRVGDMAWECEPGGSMEETYRAGGIALQTHLTTSPGEEACWVEGTITVKLDDAEQTYRVKGVSGI